MIFPSIPPQSWGRRLRWPQTGYGRSLRNHRTTPAGREPLFEDRVRDQAPVIAAKGLMEPFLCRDEQPHPGIAAARGQDQHEPSMKVAALAAEHGLLDVGRLFFKRPNYPLERVYPCRLCFQRIHRCNLSYSPLSKNRKQSLLTTLFLDVIEKFVCRRGVLLSWPGLVAATEG